MRLAYKKRRPVLITGATTEIEQTWALPDGNLKTAMHLAPVRMRGSGGGWTDVDLNLERKTDGSVAPKAHPRGLRLAGRGDGDVNTLVTLGSGAETTSLGWRGRLPQPVLDGVKATYAEVRPGVDLVVEARRTGYEYFVVVKNKQAAEGLASIALPWRTGTMRAATTARGIELHKPNEETPVATVSAAIMWDALRSPSGDPLRQVEVPISVAPDGAGGTDLVVTPGTAFFNDPTVQYPVTVDPSVNLRPAYDGFVQHNIENTDQSAKAELRLGYSDDASEGCGNGCLARSFLRFDNLSPYWGATVVSAELHLWNFHSWSCTVAQWESWRTDSAGTATRWGNQPTRRSVDGLSIGQKGYGGCADGWVSVSVRDTFQMSLSSRWSSATVGLKASTETHHNGWKKFRSSEASGGTPYVEITHNRTPNAPTGQVIDSCYVACASPAVVRSGTPLLKATVSDPNGGTLRAEYEVYDNAKTTVRARSSGSVTGVPSGTARAWRLVPTSGARLLDGTYHWRARACDSYGCGGYSGWFTFTVDTQDPSLPTISATPYEAKSTGTWNGGPGTPGTFTMGPNGGAGTREYVYRLNGGAATMVGAGAQQPERLTPNQRQVSTDLTGFTAINSTIARVTNLGRNSSQSLRITPAATTNCGDAGCTFAAVGGDAGGMRLGMQAGKTYEVAGWVYVPSGTGLTATSEAWDESIGFYYKVNGVYSAAWSPEATAVDVWQRVAVRFQLPAGTTEAFVRLFNGFGRLATGRHVYWDDLSVREIVGASTVELVTPTHDGMNSLSVQAADAAGNLSDPSFHDFLVRPNSDLNWYWSLDQNTGTAAPSAPVNNRPAAFAGSGVSWSSPGRVGPAAVALAGTGELTTASPVLDTGHNAGFTVAAWARLTDLSANRTVVSQDGVNTSAFHLGYRRDLDLDADGTADPAWCFALPAADAVGAAESRACTTDYVVEGDWVHLAGIYDPSTSKIKLYVNGTPQFSG
ncbi:MAG TPA: DNRLRE domain-containing protein, partial [Pilimelia sp.]|nr:DNRLRE domain-containing protein [Pilimelia sp.]